MEMSVFLILLFTSKCVVYVARGQINFGPAVTMDPFIIGNLQHGFEPREPVGGAFGVQSEYQDFFGFSNMNQYNYKSINWNSFDRRREEGWWHLYPFGEMYFDIDMLYRPWMDVQIDLDFFLPYYGYRFNYTFIFAEGFVSFAYPYYIQPPYTFPNPQWPNKQDPTLIAAFMSPQTFASIGDERISRVWYRIVQRPLSMIGHSVNKETGWRQQSANNNILSNHFIYRLPDGTPSIRTYGNEILKIQTGRVEDVELLNYIQEDIHKGMVGARGFVADYALIVTWERMAYGGAPKALELNEFENFKKWQNTYQMVLATDEIRTYCMLNYANINWTSSTEAGSLRGRGGRQSAIVGFNGGNGTGFFEMPYSAEGNSYKLVQYGATQTAGRWMARVDENIVYGGCTNTSTGTLQTHDQYGTMLGGYALNVSGPCFRQEHVVKLQIDVYTVDCSVIDMVIARCIIPVDSIFITGLQSVKLSVDGGKEYNFWNKFYIVAPNEAENPVRLINDPLKLVNDWNEYQADNLTLIWSAHNLTYDYNKVVDITLWGYWEDLTDHQLMQVGSIAKAIPNSGVYYFDPRTLPRDDLLRESWKKFNFGAIQVRISEHWSQQNGDGIQWSNLVPFGWFYKPIWEVEYGKDWSLDKCIDWFEYDGRLISYQQQLEPEIPCPCTLAQAQLDVGRFMPLFDCNMVGDSLCYYTKGALHCVFSVTAIWTGSSQQCCYDSNGWLMFGQDYEYSEEYIRFFSAAGSQRAHPFGSFPYRRPPFVPALSNYFNDLMPYQFCCKWARHCEFYYWRRESSGCQGYIPPVAGFAYGDPHFVTYDGTKYTFNGKGYFVLTSFKIPKKADLHVHVRMEEPPKTNWDTFVHATVITGVAAKDNNSATIQVFARKDFRRWRYKMDVFVDGTQVFFDKPWQKYLHFQRVTLFSPARNMNNSEIYIMFATGVGIRVSEARGILDVMVVLPQSYNETFNNLNTQYGANNVNPNQIHCGPGVTHTTGLLGTFNGNPYDDLMNPDCQIVVAKDLKMTPQLTRDIYTIFGTRYRVDPAKGHPIMFQEEHKPLYNPIRFAEFTQGLAAWEPVFNPANYPGLGNATFAFSIAEVEIACQGLYSCMYDYLLTGVREIGLDTLEIEQKNEGLKTLGEERFVSCGPLQKNIGVVKYPQGNNYLDGVTVTFACKPEYYLHGDERRTCINGTWSPGWWVWCRDRNEEYALKWITGILVSLLIVGILTAILCWCYCVFVRPAKRLHPEQTMRNYMFRNQPVVLQTKQVERIDSQAQFATPETNQILPNSEPAVRYVTIVPDTHPSSVRDDDTVSEHSSYMERNVAGHAKYRKIVAINGR